MDVGSIQQVRAAANELAALKPDAIVSTCSDSTAAAKQATSSSGIPVVMAFVSDPVGQGLVESYSHPGGNITGLSSQAEDTSVSALGTTEQKMPNEQMPPIWAGWESSSTLVTRGVLT